jgi:hypothetical protein
MKKFNTVKKKHTQTAAVWTANITAGRHGSGGSSTPTAANWLPLFSFFLVVIVIVAAEDPTFLRPFHRSWTSLP